MGIKVEIPCATLPEFSLPFIGVQATANDMMLHGIQLAGVNQRYARVTPAQAMEIMRQICEERKAMNAKLEEHFQANHRPRPESSEG